MAYFSVNQVYWLRLANRDTKVDGFARPDNITRKATIADIEFVRDHVNQVKDISILQAFVSDGKESHTRIFYTGKITFAHRLIRRILDAYNPVMIYFFELGLTKQGLIR